MNFIDPRRAAAEREKSESLSLQTTPIGMIKSSVLTAGISLVGIRLAGKYMSVLRSMERTANVVVEQHRAKLSLLGLRRNQETMALEYAGEAESLLNIDSFMLPDSLPDILVPGDHFSRYDNATRPVMKIGEEALKEDFVALGDDVSAQSFDEAVLPRVDTVREELESLNRYLSAYTGEETSTREELSRLLSSEKHIDREFEKDYPGFRSMVERQAREIGDDVRIKIKPVYGGVYPFPYGGYRVEFTDSMGKKAESILPSRYNTFINKGAVWQYEFKSTVEGGNVIAADRGKVITNIVKSAFKWLGHTSKSAEGSLAGNLARQINDQVSLSANMYAGDINDLAALNLVVLKDIRKRYSFDVSPSGGALAYKRASMFQGKPLRVISPEGMTVSRYKVDVRLTGEESSISGRYAGIRRELLPTYGMGRYSPRLGNLAPGVPMRVRSPENIARELSKFGFLNEDMIEQFNREGVKTTIPGDLVTTIVDFTETATGKGASIFVISDEEVLEPFTQGKPFRIDVSHVHVDPATSRQYESKLTTSLLERFKVSSSQHERLVIKRGEPIGYREGRLVTAEDDIIVKHLSVNNRGEMTIQGAIEVKAREGMKDLSTKAQVNEIISVQDFEKRSLALHGSSPTWRALGGIVTENVQKHRIVSLLDGDTSRKLLDGRFGQGIYLQVLSDVANYMKTKYMKKASADGVMTKNLEASFQESLLRLTSAMLGASVRDTISHFHLSKDGTVVPVMRGESTLMDLGGASFRTVEYMVEKAMKGNSAPLDRWIATVQHMIARHGTGREDGGAGGMPQLTADITEFLDTSYRTGFSPIFVKDMKNNSLAFAVLKNMNILHKSAMAPVASLSTLTTSKGFFPGGSKITWERVRNAMAYGHGNYAKYLQSLIGLNFDRIEELYTTYNSSYRRSFGGAKATDVLGVKKAAMRGGRVARIVDITKHKKEGGPSRLYTLLLASDLERSAKKEALNLKKNLHVMRFMDLDSSPEVIQKLLRNIPEIASDEMQESTLSGLRGNSVMLISQEVRDSLAQLIDDAPKDEQVYLKLPMSIRDPYNSAQEIQYVPMHRLYDSDLYAIDSTSLDAMYEQSTDRARMRFYTGNHLMQNTITFMTRVARLTEQLRGDHKRAFKRSAIQEELRRAVVDYRRGMNVGGKNSVLKKLITEGNMPMSATGVLYDAGGRVPFGYVGMTPDTITRIYTNNQIGSYQDAVKISEEFTLLKKYAKRVEDVSFKLKDTLSVPQHETTWSLLADLAEPLNALTSEGRRIEGVEPLAKEYRLLRNHVKSMLNMKPEDRLTRSMIKHFPEYLGTLTKDDPNLDILKDRLSMIRKAAHRVKRVGFKIPIAREEERALANTALNIIDEVRSGGFVPFRVHGSPELSVQAGLTAGIHLIEDNEAGRLTKLMKSRMREHGDVQFFMSKTMAALMGRDADRDTISGVALPFKKLQNLVGGRGIKHYLRLMGMDVSRPMDIGGREAGKDVFLAYMQSSEFQLENVLAAVERVAVAVDNEGTLIPTNASAAKAAFIASDAKYRGKVQLEDAGDHLEKVLKKAGFSDDEILQQKDVVLTRMREGASNISKNKVNLDLKVITDMAQIDRIEGVTTDTWFKNVVEREKATRLLTGDPYRGVEARIIAESFKNSFNEYLESQMDSRVLRYQAIKKGTPVVYPVSAAIIDSMKARKNLQPREALFLTLFADNAVAQQVISSKHGTPLVAAGIVSKLKQLSSGGVNDVEEVVKDLVEGNITVDVSDEERKLMKKVGILKRKTEKVSYKQYYNFMKTETEFYNTVLKKHEETLPLFLKKTLSDQHKLEFTKKGMDHRLLENYITHVDIRLESESDMITGYDGRPIALRDFLEFRRKVGVDPEKGMKIVSSSSEEWDKGRWVVTKATIRAAWYYNPTAVYDYVSNLGTLREPGDLEDMLTKYFPDKEEQKLYLRRLARQFHEQKAVTGLDPFDNKMMKAFTAMQPRDDFSILNTMNEWVTSPGRAIAYGTHGALMANQVNTIRARNIAVMSDSARKEFTAGAIASMREAGEKYAASSDRSLTNEVRNLIRLRSKAMEDQSTPFRNQSIIGTLTKKIQRVTASSEMDIYAKHIGKIRTRSIFAGAIAGFVAGQALNQSMGKYAVPGLEKPAGLGGEYYESVNGIMGRDLEISMRPTPPKVIPWETEYRRSLNEYAEVFKKYSASTVLNGDRTVIEDNRFIGGVVR